MRLVLAVLLCVAALPVHAELSGRQYLQLLDYPNARNYAAGIVEGMIGANSFEQLMGRRRIFCTRHRLSFRQNEAIRLLKRYWEDNPKELDYPISLSFLHAVQASFPCKEK